MMDVIITKHTVSNNEGAIYLVLKVPHPVFAFQIVLRFVPFRQDFRLLQIEHDKL